MKVKKAVKWPLLVIATIIIYYLSKYLPLVLNTINVVGFAIGIYWLFSPGMYLKTADNEYSQFERELKSKFKDYEKYLLAKRKELLSDYRGQYFLSIFLVGIPVLIMICTFIYLVTVSQHRWYEYVLIFCLLAFFIFHESQAFQYFPSSRFNRARLNYFINELKINMNTSDIVNKSSMIINNIEMNHSEIKNDYSHIVYDNRALIIENTKIQTQTSIDNRVTNNDNRVLQNNFVTTIDNSKKEIPQLNTESDFWKFIKIENGEEDVLLKYNRLLGVIHDLNSRLFKIGKKEFFYISDNKIHFFSASPQKC